MATHYQEYGAKLEFVTDRSQEGMQFVRGFGGIGGNFKSGEMLLPKKNIGREVKENKRKITPELPNIVVKEILRFPIMAGWFLQNQQQKYGKLSKLYLHQLS